MWCVEIFSNGTQIVVDRLAGQRHPFYRVFGPGGEGHDDPDDREKMCLDLATHLRGGPAPSWLRDMERHPIHPRTTLVGLDLSLITAAGPYIEQTTGKYTRFVQCTSDDAFARRHQLIDRLVS